MKKFGANMVIDVPEFLTNQKSLKFFNFFLRFLDKVRNFRRNFCLVFRKVLQLSFHQFHL